MPDLIGDKYALGTVIILVFEVLAMLSILHVIIKARSAPGAWGWLMAMLAVPFVAVPIYWILGRQHFRGYVERFREAQEKNEQVFHDLEKSLQPHITKLTESQDYYGGLLLQLSERRFTSGNEVCLLIDGEQTFESIFDAVEQAKDYVLVQFFIVKDDDLGNRQRELLKKKAKEGVRVYFLYDEIGSHKLPRRYRDSLRESGVNICRFNATQGRANRFQINFRNHRKIVVADGEVGFVGGHNIGDEYLGISEKFGHWRDTHVRLIGPSVLSLQMVFLADYYWATRKMPELNWSRVTEDDGSGCGAGESNVLTLPTGPTERIEGGTMFFLNAISRARRRLWIASPYFVTDESVRASLMMAALRGVDVRILIPDKPDKYIPWLATFSYLVDMEAAGVRLFRYEPGFQHQKVILVDEDFATVGTANLDNRSMRLNFEVGVVVLCKSFAANVASMLEVDFARSREIDSTDYTDRPWWFRLAVRVSRLASPLL